MEPEVVYWTIHVSCLICMATLVLLSNPNDIDYIVVSCNCPDSGSCALISTSGHFISCGAIEKVSLSYTRQPNQDSNEVCHCKDIMQPILSHTVPAGPRCWLTKAHSCHEVKSISWLRPHHLTSGPFCTHSL